MDATACNGVPGGGLRRADDFGDPRPQAPGGAELGDREELVGGRGETQLDRGERVDGEFGERGHGGGDREAELLRVGRPGVVVAGAVDRDRPYCRGVYR